MRTITTNSSNKLSRYFLKIKTIVPLFLLMCTLGIAQTTVNSLTALLPYLDDNNVNVKLAPGTYSINTSDIGDFNERVTISGKTSASILHFAGNNSTYDFTGVTINFDTAIFPAYDDLEVFEVHTTGNYNVIKNLTMVDVGSVHDNPEEGANSIVMDGQGNRIEGFNVTTKGSVPYGYGDAFGKGGTNTIIFHYKHSACLVRGESNHVKDCNFTHRAYGHCIYMQAANNPIIEGCYIEGEMRSTDDMLLEEGTGSKADNVDFMTTWGYRLPAGYMMSLAEEGIRAYNGGNTVINGVEYSRGTSNPTILNCTIKNMRAGVTLTHATGTKYVEGCVAIGCERGFAIGSGDIVNCSADAQYGPVFGVDYESNRNINADITVLPYSGNSYNGSNHLAIVIGSGHNLTFRSSIANPDQSLKLNIGGDNTTIGLLANDENYSASNIEINNLTNYPLVLDADSSGMTGESCGPIINNGSGNSVSSSDDCDSGTCSSYISNVNVPSNLISGINYSYYEGSWDALPNFSALSPVDSGTTSGINLNNAIESDYFGLTFEGYINVAQNGSYTFYTTSDDGSKLSIDGNVVVNNDGLHGTKEESGAVCLEAGYHEIEVQYFEKTGGTSLSVAYAGPDFSKTTLSTLFIQDDTVSGFVPDPSKKYYIDAPIHNLRLAASGESEDPYTTTTGVTGEDVEWQFVAKGNGSWHIQRAAGGTLPRLRTDNTANADMQPTGWSGTYTYYDFDEGFIDGTYFITLADGPTNYKRLQVDNSGSVNMVSTDSNRTWESFTITEVETTAVFSRIEAEDFNDMSGIQTEISSESGENVGWIHNGDWTRYNDINLTGAQSIEVRVACNFTGGTIEVRIGSPTGTLLGSIPVVNTGGNQSWVTHTTNINNASGIHDVYLVFTGGSGYLYNINWLEFSGVAKSASELTDISIANPIVLYPNPASEIMYLKNADGATIDMYDSFGKKVLRTKVQSDSEPLEISGLQNGMYFVKIIKEENTSYRQMIKK
ncbi:carbohydrate-binding protein [Aquimarina pacifica]|uniref:carbohydrate-binding protein n=1 Tax=Aquimarina pacifica TaxID=1296415 RepID=UPI00046F399D|nr:carbohydrate-binding protein [Aquimarina pacifica]